MIALLQFLIARRPDYEDVCREDTHAEMLARAQRNRAKGLAYRALKHRVIPNPWRRRREQAIWRQGFRTYHSYRITWREQRRFLKRLVETRRMLREELES